jgi:hypothetical protein
MPAPQLPTTISLETIRSELIFTSAALAADEQAADLVPRADALLVTWKQIQDEQLARWDAQDRADAQVATADDHLDRLVFKVALVLEGATGKNRKDRRWSLYFEVPPHKLIKPVLGDELETMKSWRTHLQQETLPGLVALAPELDAAIARAEAALVAKRQAKEANTSFRTARGLADFVDNVRIARDAIHADLAARQAKEGSGLERSWPDTFFRHRSRKENVDDRMAKAKIKAEEKARKAALADARHAAKNKVKEALAELKALSKKG